MYVHQIPSMFQESADSVLRVWSRQRMEVVCVHQMQCWMEEYADSVLQHLLFLVISANAHKISLFRRGNVRHVLKG